MTRYDDQQQCFHMNTCAASIDAIKCLALEPPNKSMTAKILLAVIAYLNAAGSSLGIPMKSSPARAIYLPSRLEQGIGVGKARAR